jgi:hypothetical protein
MLIAAGIGCALAAATVADIGGAAAWSLVPERPSQPSDPPLHLVELYDCSGCSRPGGRCPNVCAPAQAPRPSQGSQNTHGCACLHNETQRTVNFRYHWGTNSWKPVRMQAGFQYAICWRYPGGSHSSPALQFELDVDMTKGNAWTTYDIGRIQTPGSTCRAVPAGGHYTVRFRPGTGNQFIAVYRRSS